MSEPIPAVILGGAGYVSGELLRLLAGHPGLKPAAVVSRTHAGQGVEVPFPNLRGRWPKLRFSPPDGLEDALGDPGARVAVFSALPHGASAEQIARVLSICARRGSRARVVDVSADFRFRDADAYQRIYRQPHGAPELLARFRSLLPEHAPRGPGRADPAAAPGSEDDAGSEPTEPDITRHVGHPGCFATSILLAAVPLMHAAVTDACLTATGVTGSTGAGRTPKETTHHPLRHSNLFAYKPLTHRHAPETEEIIEVVSGRRPRIHFVPHSGPFARGIYLTLQARLAGGAGERQIREAYAAYYENAPFVHLLDAPPRLKDVVGSNRALLFFTVSRDTLAVSVAIDNLVKGAAGGAVQWMNRLLGLDETTGLLVPGPAWI